MLHHDNYVCRPSRIAQSSRAQRLRPHASYTLFQRLSILSSSLTISQFISPCCFFVLLLIRTQAQSPESLEKQFVVVRSEQEMVMAACTCVRVCLHMRVFTLVMTQKLMPLHANLDTTRFHVS